MSSIPRNIQKLKAIIDDFPVGAARFDTFETDDVGKSKQTINVLKSKLITQKVFENIDQATWDGDRERINRLCMDRMSCSIAASKAVSAACVNEFISKCIQMSDNDPMKENVLEMLRKMRNLVNILDKLRSTLEEKKLRRIEVESEYKREMLLHKEVVKREEERAQPPENVMKKLQVKVEKINIMRRLIKSFLLSPNMNLDREWVEVLAEVRYNVDLNELLC